ncbi:hypothetical protein [Methylobacterium nigriterrae]|uniref:hypothetical protein n=1 Tax=Methylobacterium nigriterrae TaxID=3127512 RepID=UPI0030134A91
MALPATELRSVLAGYADRGVFRGIDDGKATGDVVEFNFMWHGRRPLRCVLAEPAITLRDFLHAMPARSDICQDLRDFVKGLNDPALPEHRGVDPSRASVTTTVRNQRLSLVVTTIDGDYVYATRKLVFAAHEIWLRLQSEWVHYVWEEFGTSME